jgi:DNA-binding IclR family transcriptional regulator
MAKDADVKDPYASLKGAQSLMRALDILDQVINGPVKSADLARNLDLTRSTTHRLAQALRARDYLAITPDGYSLGPKLLQLGSMAQEQTDYVRLARPHLEALSADTGYCDWSRHLDRVTGRQRLRVATAPGDRRLIVETGIGKALLLDQSEDALTKLFQAEKPEASAKKLKDWLDAMRENRTRGVVLHESEAGDFVRSVAAPVRNDKGQIVVAISIAGAAAYLTDKVLGELANPVKAAAASIGATLGYRASTSD